MTKDKSKSNNNYKVSDKNKIYKSLLVQTSDGEKLIVGIPMKFDCESVDTNLIIDCQIPYVGVENYYERLLQLPHEKRMGINDIVNYALETGKATIHMGKNFEVLFNYIYSRERLSIVKTLENTYRIIGNYSSFSKSPDLTTYATTNYNKMCQTATFRVPNMLFAGVTCAYNFISPSFIKNGKGYLYTFTEKLPQDKIQSGNEIIEEYLHNQFKEYDRRDDIDIHTDYDKIFDIEYCLDNLVGVKGKYKKIEIQCMYKFICPEKSFNGLINTFLDKK